MDRYHIAYCIELLVLLPPGFARYRYRTFKVSESLHTSSSQREGRDAVEARPQGQGRGFVPRNLSPIISTGIPCFAGNDDDDDNDLHAQLQTQSPSSLLQHFQR